MTRALAADETGEEAAEIQFYLGIIDRPGVPDIPPEASAAMDRAEALVNSGQIVEAVEELEEAARLAPLSGEPIRRLALVRREMGLTEESIQLMRQALRLDPTLDGGHFMLGVFLSESGQHDEAIQQYEAELRVNPDSRSAHLNLALTYNFYAGNPNLAAYHYRRYRALGGEPVAECEALLRDLGGAGGS